MTHAHTLGRAGLAVLLGIALAAAAPAASDGSNAAGATSSATTHAAGKGGTLDGRIVYVNGATIQLETANPDGSAVVPLTNFDNASAQQPAWLPDSSGVVFVSNRTSSGDFRLFSVARNGTQVHKIANDRPGFAAFTPAVVPSGNAVVFSRCRPDPPGGCALYRVRMDGTGLQALTPYSHGGDFWPDVSPDGTHIAFSRVEYRGVTAQVWVMRSNGSHAHAITAPALEASYPKWTPDGEHLLVVSQWPRLGQSVYRIDADGANKELLSQGTFPNNESFATPSPSGQHILFVSDRNYPDLSGFDQFTMDANGSNQQLIQSGAFFADDWGSAPLLTEKAAPPRTGQAQPASAEQRHALDRALGRWARYLAQQTR